MANRLLFANLPTWIRSFVVFMIYIFVKFAQQQTLDSIPVNGRLVSDILLFLLFLHFLWIYQFCNFLFKFISSVSELTSPPSVCKIFSSLEKLWRARELIVQRKKNLLFLSLWRPFFLRISGWIRPYPMFSPLVQKKTQKTWQWRLPFLDIWSHRYPLQPESLLKFWKTFWVLVIVGIHVIRFTPPPT